MIQKSVVTGCSFSQEQLGTQRNANSLTILRYFGKHASVRACIFKDVAEARLLGLGCGQSYTYSYACRSNRNSQNDLRLVAAQPGTRAKWQYIRIALFRMPVALVALARP
eukprot:6203633-Pleurochrysis_carterae.AAC.1